MTGPLLFLLILLSTGLTAILVYHAGWRLPRDSRERLRGSVRAFAHAVDCRCHDRYGRSDQVCELALKIGSALGLSKRVLGRLELASYLCNIGMTAIPYQILNKSVAERTEPEQATFARHPEVGASMLELIPSLRSLAPVVQNVLAWWDGTRTPYLPAGFEIPIEARVLAVASAYSGASANRMDGVDLLESGRGTRFDPAIVDCFLDTVWTNTRPAANVGIRTGTA